MPMDSEILIRIYLQFTFPKFSFILFKSKFRNWWWNCYRNWFKWRKMFWLWYQDFFLEQKDFLKIKVTLSTLEGRPERMTQWEKNPFVKPCKAHKKSSTENNYKPMEFFVKTRWRDGRMPIKKPRNEFRWNFA